MAKKLISFDVNNEQVILASMMKSKVLRRKLSSELSEFNFVGKRHKKIFSILKCMVDIEYNEDTFDALSDGADYGGFDYLKELIKYFDAQDEGNIEIHVKKLIKDSVKHRMKKSIMPKLEELISDPSTELEDIQDELEKANGRIKNSFTDNLVLKKDKLKLEYKAELKERSMGLKEVVGFGFKEIDEELVEGMQPGKVVVITARPSMGKTTFTSNVINHVTTNLKKKVLACPLETGKSNLMDYLVVQNCQKKGWNINLGDILSRMSKIDIAKKHKINKAIDMTLDDDYLDIADSRDLTLSRLRYILQNEDYDICFIDLFEKLADVITEGANANLSQKLEEVQKIAQQTRTCIVIVSQLRRVGGKGVADKKPDLEQIKNSGKYEEVGDVIIGLYREHYYNKEVEDVIEVIVLKQRNGLRNYSAGFEFLGYIATIGESKEIEEEGW